MKIIYDLGSNNGDDIPYYLLKADKVIAVEANPQLCDFIKKRFPEEISQNRLIVENCAITEKHDGTIDFYLHNKYHVLSTLVAPSKIPDERGFTEKDFTMINIQSVSVGSLIEKHGAPYYAKIDIEGYDENILKAFATNQIFPPYISAESHTIGVFALLSERLNYKSFKLVDGESMPNNYRQSAIYSPAHGEIVLYSFPHHSAGPFGEDIHGEWMDKGTLLKVLAMQGLGWKDIHASANDKPTLSF
jgi:FkbM family methyltransferase